MAAKNTSTLRFDVLALPAKERVLDKFPLLAELPAFAEHGAEENDAWARFAILYADMGSPFVDLPLDDKKAACFAKAGCPDDYRRAQVTHWRDAGVTAMANAYVRLQNSLKWALCFHGRESAWQTIEQLSVPIEGAKTKEGDDDEAKTQTAYKTRRDNLQAMFIEVPKLEALTSELFMDDDEFGAAAMQRTSLNTPNAERRAAERKFIPAPSK